LRNGDAELLLGLV